MNDSLETKFPCRYDGWDKTHCHKTNRKRYEKTFKKKSFDLPQEKDISLFTVQKLGVVSCLKLTTVKDMS